MPENRPADFVTFERRKEDHIRLAMDPRTQATGAAGFDLVRLTHEALPDLNFSEISLQTHLLGQNCSSPFYISSMTAGHEKGELINQRLARFASTRKILMGIGSQRRELTDQEAGREWQILRRHAPDALFIGNLGIAQIIQTAPEKIQDMLDALGAVGLFVHLNPLQECLQPEGTPQFRGGLRAIENLVKAIKVPLIMKEVGCGISPATISRLEGVGVSVIDVSGLGGTHWGRIESLRAQEETPYFKAGTHFQHWGLPTLECLALGQEIVTKCDLWASGGVRSGVDAAKLLAMGAGAVGIAQPFLGAALASEEALNKVLDQYEFELKVAMFCTGIGSVDNFREKEVWTWN